MPKIALLNMQGASAGEMELSEAVFGQAMNEPVVHQVIVARWPTSARARRARSPAAKWRAAASSRGVRRERAVPVRVPPARPSGGMAAWFSPRSPAIIPRVSIRRCAAWQ